jgi:probable F420-dependent oxidoreductase
VKVGFYLPTAAEGTFYSSNLIDRGWVRSLAELAEDRGFAEISVSDYVSLEARLRSDGERQPAFYESMVTVGWLAAVTSSVELVVNVLVLPLREVVVAAKQAMTLQELAEGRLVLGVGLGASREEFLSLHPEFTKGRGALYAEQLEALQLLLREPTASYAGRFVRFEDVALHPKPAVPVPLPVGGNSPKALERALAIGDGWIPFMPGLGLLEEAQAAISAAGQTEKFKVRPLVVVALGADAGAAAAHFDESHFGRYFGARMGDGLRDRNLVGTPDQISELLGGYEKLGVDRPTLVFVGDTQQAIEEQIELFVEEVAWTPAH